MKISFFLLPLCTLALYACTGTYPVSSGPNPFSITPSRQPLILTTTPIFVFPTNSPMPLPPPSFTATSTVTAGPTNTSTETPTSTVTYTPTASLTSTPAPIEISLLGCETGFDVTHGMGEVTNAYVMISNPSGPELTLVCATLSSADEGRTHPNKTSCVPNLPGGYRVPLKLTIDTTFSAATIVQINVSSDQGRGAITGGLACNAIGTVKPTDDLLGIIQPIQ